VLVGAAGNYYMFNEVLGGLNYDNALQDSTSLDYIYFMRGPSPGASTDVISVSAVDNSVIEKKAGYSNAGPRTNIFAPGTSIISTNNSGSITDPRNSSYFLNKQSGSSMACPQVTGVLACALETYPTMNQSKALEYLITNCSKNQLSDNKPQTTYPFLNYDSLLNGPNRYLKYKKERADSGQILPKRDFNSRPESGLVYPRVKKRILG
jgi:subtilisin family serine protease